jgi:tetratricopeptide (TPR) repeat protein
MKKTTEINTDKNPAGETLEIESLLQSGDHYTSIGDLDRGEKCYSKAALLDSDKADPYVGLGMIAFKKKLLDDAEISFRVACRLDSNCCKAYCGLAMVAQEKEDYDRAFEMYLKSLQLDQDNLTALLGLFQASCQMGSFAKVIDYLELYLQMHAEDNSVKFSLAALYIKEGCLDKSRKMLLEILASGSDNKDAADLLEEVEHNLAQMRS